MGQAAATVEEYCCSLPLKAERVPGEVDGKVDGASTSRQVAAPRHQDRPHCFYQGGRFHQGLMQAPVGRRPPKLKVSRASCPPEGSSRGGEAFGTGQFLGEGVELSVHTLPNFAFIYTVRNRKLANLNFSLSFEGSVNFGCPEWNGSMTRTSVIIPPMSSMMLGTVRRLQPGRAKLQTHFSWFHDRPPRENQDQRLKFERKVREEINAVRSMGLLGTEDHTASEITQVCRKAGVLFTDPDFPPALESLYSDGSSEGRAPILWRRPRDIPQEPGRGWSIFKESEGPERWRMLDIELGALGDHWLLAAMAAIAEVPILLDSIFSSCRGVSDIGLYELFLWPNGVKTRVVIDDWFPCDAKIGRPCYSHCKGNLLWVMLLEKAFAKFYGSYQHLESGLVYRAMMDLTGAPGWCIVNSNFDLRPTDLSNNLLYLHSLGCLIVATMPEYNELRNAVVFSHGGVGLMPGFAYAVVDVSTHGYGCTVKLRNPFSVAAPSDEYISMEIEELIETFAAMHVIDYARHDRRLRSVMEVVSLGDAEEGFAGVFELDVTADTSGYITLWQQSEKIRSTKAAFALYGPLGQPNEKEVLRSAFAQKRDLVEEMTKVEPGQYFLTVWTTDSSMVDVGDGGAAAAASEERDPAMILVSTVVPPKKEARKLAPAVPMQAIFSERRKSLLEDRGPRLYPLPLTRDVREAAVLASVMLGGVEPFEHDSFTLLQGWLPNGGFAIAARCKEWQSSVTLEFTFAGTEGLRLYTRHPDWEEGQPLNQTKVRMTLRPGESRPELVAEFVPVAEKRAVAFTFSMETSMFEEQVLSSGSDRHGPKEEEDEKNGDHGLLPDSGPERTERPEEQGGGEAVRTSQGSLQTFSSVNLPAAGTRSNQFDGGGY